MNAPLLCVWLALLALPILGRAEASAAVFEPRTRVTAGKILGRSDRVVIAGFRVAFNRESAAAAGRKVTLTGVDGVDFQRITEEAYADFRMQLAREGVTVLGLEVLRASPGYGQLTFTPCSPDRPYGCEVGAAASLVVFTPAELPLFLGHFDADGLAGGISSLDSWRALNRLSVETRAVVLVPTLVVDFLRAGEPGSDGEAGPGIALAPRLTGVVVFHGKLRLAGDLGHLRLGEPLAAPGAFGSLRAVADQPWRVLAARPADYRRLSLDAVRSFNRTAGAFIAAK